MKLSDVLNTETSNIKMQETGNFIDYVNIKSNFK